MHTAHLLPYRGSLRGQTPPGQRSRGQRPPHTETCPGQIPLGQRPPLDSDPPWTETPPWIDTPQKRPPGQRSHGHVTCNACWDRDLPLNRMTHSYKNITLLQTSFASCINVNGHCQLHRQP